MIEELHQLQRCPDHVGAFFHHCHAAGPEHGTGLSHRFEVHFHIEVLFGKKCSGRSARNDGLQGFVGSHPAGVLVDQLAECHAHGDLVVPRKLHVPADAEDAGAGALWRRPNRGEPFGASSDDIRQIRQGFHVVHHGRFVIETVRGGEWRLDAGKAALAFH